MERFIAFLMLQSRNMFGRKGGYKEKNYYVYPLR